MRKLLAVLLAAMMLVGAFAILPVGAADSTLTSPFDGTTNAEAQVPDLVITEVLIDSKTGDPDLDDQLKDGGTDVSTLLSPDAFDYIEIYNRGLEEVCLYDYAIAAANGNNFSNATSSAAGKFTLMVEFAKGELRQNPSAKNGLGTKLKGTDSFVNPVDEQDVMLQPGQFAVIWFYGEGTSKLTQKRGTPLQAKDFRDHYGMPESTKLIAVPAVGGVGSLFELTHNYTYALVEKEYKTTEDAVSNPYQAGASLNSKIVCMFDYTLSNAVGIFKSEGMDDAAAYYVPANCIPDALNKVNEQIKEEGKDAVVFNSYVEANYIASYRATANISFTQEPSPGTMPAWQWAYVDPVGATKTVTGSTYRHGLQTLSAAAEGANYDATMKALVTDWETNTEIKKDNKLDVTVTNGKVAWSTKCINSFVTENSQVNTDEGGEAEEKINYKDFFVKREDLEKRHGLNKKTSTTQKEGLPTWALILIIVGGVVLLGAVAVVIIIVIKKKNKPVAADDVAAEGEIEIVDETATTEAPSDEAAAADVPSDESNE